MTVSSLTQLAAGGASNAASIKKSSSALASSIAAVSSGKRISQAFQDIASLSIGTALQTQVTGLRQASQNIAQSSSLLQVADGGLGQIGDILQRLQSLSVQSNSGTLSDSARKGLNTEYQQLAQEINRLSGNTNFNSVKLLDGSLSSGSGLTTSTNNATQASGALQFSGNLAGGQTVVLNGVTLTAGANFAVGGTLTQTIDNLASALNSSTNTNLSGATYQRVGNSLEIKFDAGGSIGNQFTINQGASTAGGLFTVAGSPIPGGGNIFSLQGGSDNGISGNNTSVNGVVGDTLVGALNNSAASTSLSFTSAANIVAGNSINIDDGNGGLVNFTFVNGAPTNNSQIQIGATLEDTLANASATINNFSGTNDFVVRQLNAQVSGNSIVITGNAPGNVNDAVGAAANITLTTAGGSISNTVLNNGSTGGVNASGVTNAAFTGTISGFSATQTGTDSVLASVTVGGVTYSANIANTNSGANNTVRFNSTNGGFFDVQLSGGNGQAVNSQTDANSFASRLDTAFSGLSFSQNRQVDNFGAGGLLNGARLSIQGTDFNANRISSVNAFAATGGSPNATFEVTINGETFRNSALGKAIGIGESVTLTSLTDSNKTLTFTNGVNRIDLTNQDSADQFASAFKAASGASSGGGGLSVQVGADASDSVRLNIGDASVNGLFANGLFDLLSANNASLASGAVSTAIDLLTSLRADVGAYQEALNYTGANIDSALQNQEAARANLLDTDIASESTQLAIAALQQQSGIALQAQVNRLIPTMLDLLKGS